MPGNGPPPKPGSISQQKKKSSAPPTTVLTAEGHAVQPPLPDRANGQPWCEATKTWWDTWKDSPQHKAGIIATESDWQYLADTALLHQAVWGDGELKWLAELRLRVSAYGATYQDRLKLRLTFADTTVAEGKAAQSTERRQRRQMPKNVTAEAVNDNAVDSAE